MLNTLVLRFTPLIAGLVTEPWSATATILAMLRQKLVAREKTAPVREMSFGTREVLKAGTALLGVCIVIIVALSLANVNAKTWSDEIAWVAAVLMIASLLLGRIGAPESGTAPWQMRASYWSFLAGALALLLSVAAAAWQL